jgi:Domain of Unknown Function (DUF928)
VTSRSLRHILVIISLIIASFPISKTKAFANSRTTNLFSSSFQLAFKFNLPPKGAPGSRKGAAARDSCQGLASETEMLTALVPGTNLGLTIAERPTFWFYVPYQPNKRFSLEFSLKDKEKKEVYQQTFPLMNTPGIINIPLPENVTPLEVEKSYTWQLKLRCNRNYPNDYRLVEGLVKRVSLSTELKNQIEAATSKEQIALYAENGLWFDSLTHLIELRRSISEDKELAADWANLLQAVKLEELIDKPLIFCCEVIKSP